jgi:YidC/Oxa1 family membrane protein insertase
VQILAPIEWVVAWVIYGAHQVFTFIGFPEGPGWAWVLSVVMLTVVMRAAMIPLFVKQIKATRGQQLIQPEIQAIQAKYKGKTDPASREALSRETMALYKENGTNPFSSCLPILLQSPIFFALFRVLNAIGPIAYGERDGIGPITQSLAFDIQGSSFFGARLSDTFMATDSWPTRIVIIVLILLMSASTFYTQRQLTRKNMPAASLQGPAANMQKMMLYVFPLIFMISGVNFPVGVLIYWTVTNLWSMGQQYYTIKRMPNPGTDAERELKEKRARKAARKGIVLEPVVESTVVEPKGQRQQPQRKNRSKKS